MIINLITINNSNKKKTIIKTIIYINKELL